MGREENKILLTAMLEIAEVTLRDYLQGDKRQYGELKEWLDGNPHLPLQAFKQFMQKMMPGDYWDKQFMTAEAGLGWFKPFIAAFETGILIEMEGKYGGR